MPYTIEHIEGEPIISIDVVAPFNPEAEIPIIHERTAELAGNIEGQAYRLVDFTQSGFNFGQVVMGLKAGTMQRDGGVRDQRLRSYFVVSDDMSKLVATAMSQEQYGAIPVEIFESKADALAAIRAEIKALRQAQ